MRWTVFIMHPIPLSHLKLRMNGRLDFGALLTTVVGIKKPLKKVTRQWLRKKILEQFRLAENLAQYKTCP